MSNRSPTSVRPLSPRERRAVLLSLDDRTPAEIAARFGVSVWAVYKRLSRAAAKVPALRRPPTGRRPPPMQLSAL